MEGYLLEYGSMFYDVHECFEKEDLDLWVPLVVEAEQQSVVEVPIGRKDQE